MLYCVIVSMLLYLHLGETNSGIHMFFECGRKFGFEQKFWRIDGFGEKQARISGLAYPYPPPLKCRNMPGNMSPDMSKQKSIRGGCQDETE